MLTLRFFCCVILTGFCFVIVYRNLLDIQTRRRRQLWKEIEKQVRELDEMENARD